MVGENAHIGENVIVKEGAIIEDGAFVGDDCYLDYGCIIRKGVHLEKNSYVGAYCILGERGFPEAESPKLQIGENALIRSQTVIYAGCTIGQNFQTGHKVTIREKTIAGNNWRVGTLSDIQGDCVIGDYVNMHSNVHIGKASKIGNYVWIFPYCVLTNDPLPPSEETCGVVIDDFAVIATKSVLLPGVHVGKDAMVGAGSVVTKDIPTECVAFGNPAKQKGSVREILNKDGEVAYPWRNHFERGMPWENLGYEEWSENRFNEE